jgi:enoyl-CoA hydratase/carnithine racemase
VSIIDLERRGDVVVARWVDGENRYRLDSLARWDEILTELEAADGPLALVVTGEGKFFSNGLDLDWLGAHADQLDSYLDRVHRLFAQYLTLPCATVAALNGHTYAAGAMVAICHDHRIMRTDRGYWCLPEVDLAMPFTPGMNALIAAMVPARTAHEAMVTGRRYTAAEALAAGIVDEVADEPSVLDQAVAAAARLAPKAGANLAGIRTQLHRPVLDALALGGRTA